MTRAREKLDGASGIAAGVLFLAGFGLLSAPPAPGEPAAEIGAFLAERRGEIFAATLLAGAGACIFVWFLAALAVRLTGNEATVAAGAAGLTGLAGAILVVAGLSVMAGVASHAADESVAVAGFDVANAMVTVAGLSFSASVAGLVVAGRRAGRMSPALQLAGVGVAGLQLAALPGLWAEDGVLAPGGVVAVAAFWALTGWFVALAGALLRGRLGVPVDHP